MSHLWVTFGREHPLAARALRNFHVARNALTTRKTSLWYNEEHLVRCNNSARVAKCAISSKVSQTRWKSHVSLNRICQNRVTHAHPTTACRWHIKHVLRCTIGRGNIIKLKLSINCYNNWLLKCVGRRLLSRNNWRRGFRESIVVMRYIFCAFLYDSHGDLHLTKAKKRCGQILRGLCNV